MTADFLFLLLKDHPYGCEMLRILLANRLCPSCIVQEVSPLAEEERAKFLIRITGQSVPPPLADLIADRDVPCFEVGDHNDFETLKILSEIGAPLVVLGGTRIIRRSLLDLPPLGTINAHPGLLPRLRGSSSVAWALYKDLPVGSIIHYVDPSIDTGPIILRRELPVYRGETYEEIVRRVLTLSGELMAESLKLFQKGVVPRGIAQDATEGETMRVIPPKLLQEAKGRLARGDYSHLKKSMESSHG